MTTSNRIVWPTFLVSLLAGLLVVGTCTALYLREADQINKGVLDRDARRTEIFAHFFEEDIQSIVKDLRQLADSDGLKTYLATGQQADLDRAIHRASFFSVQNPPYDQVRYLDEHGQEIIRVNQNGVVVPRAQLQNKADRSYFQKANALGPGEFFISAFDLNVENGQVEQPIKPIIRVATPIFDATGRRRGIYIINYLGSTSIDSLLDFSPQYRQRLRILNAQGYWLKAAQPEQEWGFILPGRSGFTLAKADPALWAQISHDQTGQTPHGGGYFTWYRIAPRDLVPANTGAVTAEDDFLVVASEITPDEWATFFSALRQTFFIIAVLLLLLTMAIAWFVHLRRKAQQDRDRFFTLTRDMLCIAGFDGYFKRLNPAWEAALGYTKEEMLASPFLDFVHPDDRKRTVEESARLTRGGEIISFENRYRCKDGSYRWLLWSARSLMGERLICASARDLTERKRVEGEVLKLNEELKHRAGLLEVANKELESFSYSVSHDLRAPLRHIHGFVELLQKSPSMQAEESNRRYMAVIATAAKQMGVLIDDLLAFSRTGRAEMHPAEIDMQELVNQIVQDLEMEYKGRKVAWDIKPLPKVAGDPALLRLVWMNLLVNALKYSRPRAETKIEIGQATGQNSDTGDREAVFYVRDNGVGFDMQYASKLFGVFQRLHRAEDFEGTGIGLANVQRIIHRHGGRVWAEGKVDSGATFYFTLPLTEPQSTQSP